MIHTVPWHDFGIDKIHWKWDSRDVELIVWWWDDGKGDV
jgi:hypothetical protein